MPDNKSEKPTAQKLRKAREEGQYLSSRGMLTAVQFVVFVWLIGQILPAWSQNLQRNMGNILARAFASEISTQIWISLLRSLILETLVPLLVLGGAIVGSTLVIQLSMTRLGFSLKKLTPQIKNFNPIGKLSAMPMQNLKAAGEAVFLILTLGIAINSLYHEQTALFLQIPFQGLKITAAEIASAVHGLLWKASIVFSLFGVVDVAFQYRRHMSQLKMSKQEVKEEHKRSDGDPQIKMRIRRLRRELLRRQMMKQVPQATAVIVNPTHFAVAIRYDMETMSSPIVVAKGKNWLALRIRHVATQNEVPIIENPPLARALYDAAEIGSAISPEFYKAIAEILAYVYKLMGRKLPA
jgi:flagellar biosynthetic protein FlhB